MGFVGQRFRIDFWDKSTLVETNSSVASGSLRNKAGLRFNRLISLKNAPFLFF